MSCLRPQDSKAFLGGFRHPQDDRPAKTKFYANWHYWQHSTLADGFKPLPLSAAQPCRAFFNKIKQCRRIAIRYNKLAINYLAFIKLASIRIWLRAYESTP
jgi:transposase